MSFANSEQFAPQEYGYIFFLREKLGGIERSLSWGVFVGVVVGVVVVVVVGAFTKGLSLRSAVGSSVGLRRMKARASRRIMSFRSIHGVGYPFIPCFCSVALSATLTLLLLLLVLLPPLLLMPLMLPLTLQ